MTIDFIPEPTPTPIPVPDLIPTEITPSVEGEEPTPEPKEETLNEVTVVEAGGRQFVLKTTSARVYLEYNKWLGSRPEYAEIYLLKQIYEVDGNPLTDADVLELSSRQRAKLMRVVSSFDSLVTIHDGADAFEDSMDFSIGDVRVWAQDIPGADFTRLRSSLAQRPTKTLEEYACKYYKVSGSPDITKETIDLPYPQGIGFTVMAGIATHLISPFVSSQATQI